jgi:hypothetical protein
MITMHTHYLSRTAFLATALVSMHTSMSVAQVADACQRRTDCVDVPRFTANVTDFRTSQTDRGVHIITTTVRFQNKTTRPLALGYVRGSGLVTDDQGNRYEVPSSASVRGIGEIASTFDPKFVLQPGEASDARFELVFQAAASKILGTKYEIDLAVREIDPVAGNQLRLGKEHALHFRGFGANGVVASASASPPPSAAAPAASASDVAATPPAAAPMPDPCLGKTRCYGAGPFVAEVDQFAASTEGNRRYHVLHINVKVRNVSTQPLILAYKAKSGAAIDNLGNRYYWGHAGSYDNSASGIGKVEGQNADPQFQLAPGEARTATFALVRYDANGHEIGTSFTHDLTLTQLEVLPSRQIRVARDYAVSFKELGLEAGDQTKAAANAATNAAANAAASRLFDALKKRKKP